MMNKNKTHAKGRISSFIGLVVGFLLTSTSVFAFPPYNMPYGVTPISHEIFDLHMTTFYVCCVIGFIVFIAMVYSLIKFRHSKGAKTQGPNHSMLIEVIWTVIPFLILVALAVPATEVLIQVHDTAKPKLNIKITGYQWRWHYEYLDQGISFFSDLSTPNDQIYGHAKKDKWFLLEVDHPLVLPIGEKIRLLVTSNDVIHDWWVPALAVKQDAIPGYVNENWTRIDKVGTYRGQCGELCGTFHGFMPIVVKAVTQKDFAKWVAKETHGKVGLYGIKPHAKPVKLSAKQLLILGKKTYDTTCAVCHQSSGQGLPPTFPAIKGGKIAIGAIGPHIDIVLNGKKGTAMQAFGGQLSNAQIAAVVTYQRHAWGNDTLIKKNKHTLNATAAMVEKLRHNKKGAV